VWTLPSNGESLRTCRFLPRRGFLGFSCIHTGIQHRALYHSACHSTWARDEKARDRSDALGPSGYRNRGSAQSFALISVPANTTLAGIHKRMPAILKPSEYDRWLDRNEVEQPPRDLLRPYPDGMYKFRANLKVGNSRNQGPELLHSA
jgi:putative SOS response-associated peptidase YedK